MGETDQGGPGRRGQRGGGTGMGSPNSELEEGCRRDTNEGAKGEREGGKGCERVEGEEEGGRKRLASETTCAATLQRVHWRECTYTLRTRT